MKTLPFKTFEASLNALLKEKEYCDKCNEVLGIHLTNHLVCDESIIYLLSYIFGREDDEMGEGVNIILAWLALHWGVMESLGIDEETEKKIPKTIRELYDLLVLELPEEIPTMSLDLFSVHMENIQNERAALDSFSEIGFGVGENINTVDHAISLLEFVMGDEDDSISWWVYEKECGTREDINTFDERDNVIPLSTVQQLYAYLENCKAACHD